LLKTLNTFIGLRFMAYIGWCIKVAWNIALGTKAIRYNMTHMKNVGHVSKQY
jgi:hypothetical protein